MVPRSSLLSSRQVPTKSKDRHCSASWTACEGFEKRGGSISQSRKQGQALQRQLDLLLLLGPPTLAAEAAAGHPTQRPPSSHQPEARTCSFSFSSAALPARWRSAASASWNTLYRL